MRMLLLFFLIIVTASGCYWESEDTLFPSGGVCDTLDVSFSQDIVSILSSNCYSCHSNANAPGFASGIALQDYEDVAASSAVILGTIKHEKGFSPMPKNGEKLDSCQIVIFEAWVNSGNPDN